MSLTDSHLGIWFSFQDSINSTLDSLAKSLSISWPASITVKLKEGGDGSGSHALYHQLSNVNTHNMFMYMLCVLKISDTRTGVPLYICNAPDSPHNQRPLFILMGKESAEIIGDDIKRIDRERHALREGFILRESGVSCSVESNITTIDAKMRKTLSG